MKAMLVAAAAALMLAGCATAPSGDFCAVATPRRPSKEQIAVMPRDQKMQDLAFNRYGAEHCGWRP